MFLGLLFGFALCLIIIILVNPPQHSNETDCDSHLYSTTASKYHHMQTEGDRDYKQTCENDLCEQGGNSGSIKEQLVAVNEELILQQSKMWIADDGLKVLLLGSNNMGKSSLIKGLFEKNEKGSKFKRNRQSKVNKSLKLNDVSIFVTIVNLPLNASEKLEDYHLIMYAIKASETRYCPHYNNAIEKLKEHGDEVINKTVFVLTYANEVSELNNKSEPLQSKEILTKKTTEWKNSVNETLNFKVKPEQFVLAGHPSEPELYGTHWPSEILAGIYYRLEGTQRHALARACDSYWIRSLQGNREPGNCAT